MLTTISWKRYLDNTRDTLLVRVHTLFNIIHKSPTELFEVFMAMSSLVWAALLFKAGNGVMFLELEYHIMAHYANENTWASLFLIQGILGLCNVLFKIKDNIYLITSNILGCILWTASCVSIFLAVTPPPADISAGLITVWFSWWLLLRTPLGK